MSDHLEEARAMADRVEAFIRGTVVPCERDPRRGAHGPDEDLVEELRALAREAGVMTPHIREDGSHHSQRATAIILEKTGLSPLGPAACNTAAPDEGNMLLLGKAATPEQKARFLAPLKTGHARSAFFMTEPAELNGAGSDPSMMACRAEPVEGGWRVNGEKTFITGAVGAKVGLVMAQSAQGACLFLVDLPDPAIQVIEVLDTMDGTMPGGHARIMIKDLFVPADQVLGEPGDGFRLAQIRLAPARLSHCMRWLGLAVRAQEQALDYACRREAFGQLLVDHEGVGFKLAENEIALQQSRLMIDWCAAELDAGGRANEESSMTKVAVSEALFGIADRCVQVMGGQGVNDSHIPAQLFRETRCFRIYDGPTEVHKWSLAKKLKKRWKEAQA